MTRLDETVHEQPPTLGKTIRLRRLLRYGFLILLAGYLLFAHGCHGDEDDELFAYLLNTFF